ncbi:MAG TPA: BlaI/MecI/CopY family transcriptional regulator, partial [Tissierellaceae bacterium]
MEVAKISDAEYEIMRIIWESKKELSAKDIMSKLDKNNEWKHTTVLTLANRLVDKNVLKVRKEKRNNYYSARLSKDEYKSYQADDFIEDMYGGSVKS